MAIFTVIIRSPIMNHPNPKIKSSPNDSRQYQSIKLDNGLQVLLISDPSTTKSSASMLIKAGSGYDPKEFAGLAHFLEHMLFLGTSKYPHANEYQKFINKHSGSHNAYTAYNETNFYFNINNNEFTEAIERFSDFFVSPLLDKQYISQEVNAIEAEYSSKLQDDGWRTQSVIKQLMNPAHSYSKFNIGNLKTLSYSSTEVLRKKLIEFYDTHYFAKNMRLVLASYLPISELESLATQYFSNIRSEAIIPQDSALPISTPSIFISSDLPIHATIQPQKEIRQLKFIFPMPEIRSHYKNKPTQIIGHLIGHEGPTSLLEFLKQKKWARTLSAGSSINTPIESTFNIDIQLTEKGLDNIEAISQSVFYYIDHIKNTLLPKYLYKELKSMSDLSFRFQPKGDLNSLVIRLARHMTIYPIEDVIYGPYRHNGKDLNTQNTLLSYLNTDNAIRIVVAQKTDVDQYTPWFNTPYKMTKNATLFQVDLALQEELNKTLTLPSINPFIPNRFTTDTRQNTRSVPSIIDSEKGYSLWYYPENTYKIPKNNLFINWHPANFLTAKKQLISQLFSTSVNYALNSYSYSAHLAGIRYNLSSTKKGIQLVVSGYHDKANVLLTEILNTMNTLSLTDALFLEHKRNIKRQLENQLKAKPYQKTLSNLKGLLINPSFTEEEYLHALPTITLNDILSFNQSLKGSHINAYSHGTIQEPKAKSLFYLVKKTYKPEAQDVPSSKITKIDKQYQTTVFSDHKDHAITLYYQSQHRGDKARASFSLLAQLMKGDFFGQLRTEQKLGYIVFATSFPLKDVPGIGFIIQSPDTQPSLLYKACRQFIETFYAQLKTLSDEDFTQYKDGLISKLLEPQKNMNESASRFWQEITTERSGLKTYEDIAEEIKKIKKEELIVLYQQVFLSPQNRSVLVTSDKNDNQEPIEGHEFITDEVKETFKTFNSDNE
jgi:insulysin